MNFFLNSSYVLAFVSWILFIAMGRNDLSLDVYIPSIILIPIAVFLEVCLAICPFNLEGPGISKRPTFFGRFLRVYFYIAAILGIPNLLFFLSVPHTYEEFLHYGLIVWLTIWLFVRWIHIENRFTENPQ